MFCSPLILSKNSVICATFTIGQILSFVHYVLTEFLHVISAVKCKFEGLSDWFFLLVFVFIVPDLPHCRAASAWFSPPPWTEPQAGPLWQRTAVGWPQPTLLHVCRLRSSTESYGKDRKTSVPLVLPQQYLTDTVKEHTPSTGVAGLTETSACCSSSWKYIGKQNEKL